jgi:hypothetical protein
MANAIQAVLTLSLFHSGIKLPPEKRFFFARLTAVLLQS